MVVWDLMACPFFEPSGTTTIATVKVAMMGHPDHGSVSGGDGAVRAQSTRAHEGLALESPGGPLGPGP